MRLDQSVPLRPFTQELSAFSLIAWTARQYNIAHVVRTTTRKRNNMLDMIKVFDAVFGAYFLKFVTAVITANALSFKLQLDILLCVCSPGLTDKRPALMRANAGVHSVIFYIRHSLQALCLSNTISMAGFVLPMPKIVLVSMPETVGAFPPFHSLRVILAIFLPPGYCVSPGTNVSPQPIFACFFGVKKLSGCGKKLVAIPTPFQANGIIHDLTPTVKIVPTLLCLPVMGRSHLLHREATPVPGRPFIVSPFFTDEQNLEMGVLV